MAKVIHGEGKFRPSHLGWPNRQADFAETWYLNNRPTTTTAVHAKFSFDPTTCVVRLGDYSPAVCYSHAHRSYSRWIDFDDIHVRHTTSFRTNLAYANFINMLSMQLGGQIFQKWDLPKLHVECGHAPKLTKYYKPVSWLYITSISTKFRMMTTTINQCILFVSKMADGLHLENRKIVISLYNGWTNFHEIWHNWWDMLTLRAVSVVKISRYKLNVLKQQLFIRNVNSFSSKTAKVKR